MFDRGYAGECMLAGPRDCNNKTQNFFKKFTLEIKSLKIPKKEPSQEGITRLQGDK